jgi:hypothetical protein
MIFTLNQPHLLYLLLSLVVHHVSYSQHPSCSPSLLICPDKGAVGSASASVLKRARQPAQRSKVERCRKSGVVPPIFRTIVLLNGCVIGTYCVEPILRAILRESRFSCKDIEDQSGSSRSRDSKFFSRMSSVGDARLCQSLPIYPQLSSRSLDNR